MTAELKNWQTSMLNGRNLDTAHNRVRVECVFAKTPSPEKENEIKAFLSRKYPGKELIYQISINLLSWAVCASVSAMKNTIGPLSARIRQLKDASDRFKTLKE